MTSTEVVLTGEQYPVRIGGSGGFLARRVQSFSTDQNRTAEEDFEMGTIGMIGVGVGPWMYTGRMATNLIDTSIERAFIAEATATNDVTLKELMAAAGISVEGKDDGVGGCVIQSINYNVSVPNGKVTAEYSFKGTSKLAGVLALTSPVSGGISSYRSPKAFVALGTVPGSHVFMQRVKSVAINLQFRAAEEFELSSSDPFSISQTGPQVTATIEYHNTVLSPADPADARGYRPVPEPSSGDDLIVQIIPSGLIAGWGATGAIVLTVYNLVTESNRKSQALNQTGSRTIAYRSEGDATTGGFKIQVTA
ncbi:MAG: hypothetical protein WBC34_05410 [Thiofilum sp.]